MASAPAVTDAQIGHTERSRAALDQFRLQRLQVGVVIQIGEPSAT